MITFRITSIDGDTHFYDFGDGTINIGRAMQNQIRLGTTLQSHRKRTSRIHARITTKGKKVYIEDLNSKNGTWVNHQKITSLTEFVIGARVSLGDYIITRSPSPKKKEKLGKLHSVLEKNFYNDFGQLKENSYEIQEMLHKTKLIEESRKAFRKQNRTKINDGFFLNPGTKRLAESFTNCSLCTAAAIAREGHPYPWTARTVYLDIGGTLETLNPNASLARAFVFYYRNQKIDFSTVERGLNVEGSSGDQAVKDQVAGLKKWCDTKTPCLGILKGDMAGVLKQMNSQPNHRAFAVFIRSTTSAHWIYAYKGRGQLTFVDFQTDRTEWLDSAPTFHSGPIAPDGYEITKFEGWKMTALIYKASRLRTRFRFISYAKAKKNEVLDDSCFDNFDF